MRRLVLLCAFIAAIPAAAAAAPADPGRERVTVSVRVIDLDLTTSRGGRTALRRLSHAAFRACGGAVVSQEVIAHSGAFRRCRAEALATAVAHAAIPAISQAYAESAGPALMLARR